MYYIFLKKLVIVALDNSQNPSPWPFSPPSSQTIAELQEFSRISTRLNSPIGAGIGKIRNAASSVYKKTPESKQFQGIELEDFKAQDKKDNEYAFLGYSVIEGIYPIMVTWHGSEDWTTFQDALFFSADALALNWSTMRVLPFSYRHYQLKVFFLN